MKYKILIGLTIVAGIIVGLLLFAFSKQSSPLSQSTNTQSSTQSSSTSKPSANSTPSTSTSTKIYTASEVSNHSSANDCWLIIEGNVYDVTNFVKLHPGGYAILRYCGRDATKAFESNPLHSDGSTDANGNTARQEMKNLYIGKLQ